MFFNNNKNICIIVLTYNNINIIKDFIDIINYNTSIKFNLLLFDNNSTDGTKDYLSQIKNKNIKIIFNEENFYIIQGRNEAHKCALDWCNPDYVCFLDSDQFVKKDWLKNHLGMMENQKSDIIGIEAWKMRDNDFYPISRIKNPAYAFSYVGCGSMIIKRRVIEKIGLFSEDYERFYFEDPDFIFRAYKENFKIGWNYNHIINHNHCGPLLSQERKKYFIKNWNTFRKKWKNYKIPILRIS